MRTITAHSRGIRSIAASAAVVAGLTGLAACSDSAGPEDGAVTTEDLQEIEDDITALEDQVAGLEGAATDAAADTADMEDADGAVADLFGDDPESLVGQQVTVSAEISELVVNGDSGAAFMIGDDSGEPIAVIATDLAEDLQANDVVEVSGTVTTIQRDTFEEDFGVAPDDLFTDADGFFSDSEGEVALAADSVAVIDQTSEE